jgi:hypothetical protein
MARSPNLTSKAPAQSRDGALTFMLKIVEFL